MGAARVVESGGGTKGAFGNIALWLRRILCALHLLAHISHHQTRAGDAKHLPRIAE